MFARLLECRLSHHPLDAELIRSSLGVENSHSKASKIEPYLFGYNNKEKIAMSKYKIAAFLGLILLANSVWASPPALDSYKTLTSLQGVWKLAPADKQEGGATKKGPAAKLVGTDKTAMSFKVIGKGSTVQENLLPGTGKEMATMYHCNDFKNCSQVQATHYCAKQNQPELSLDAAGSSDHVISMTCDMSSALCNSSEGHVHKITHELSQDKNNLKSTYTIFKGGKFKKNSVYHFVRK